MARTLPEGDPRYATDFLPRGAAGSWWPWPRLCQELRTQELAGVLRLTWRRFDPSSSPSAIDLGSLLSSAVDQPQNPQQTATFQVNDRTGDYRRDGNLRRETTFFSKASYFAVLVQF